MSNPTELLERFCLSIDHFSAALAGLAPGEVDFEIAPGKWTIRQIAAHLADSELVTGMRYRQVIAEDNPSLPGYDQERWATTLDYSHRDPHVAAVTFHQIRSESHALLKSLPESAFARTGRHSERGEVSLLNLLDTYTVHAERHIEQIRGIRDTFRNSASA